MAQGECNCGKVAFEVMVPLTDVYVCHCSICRRSTGTHGIAVAVVKAEEFRWLRGESDTVEWAKPGHDWQNRFCTTCGSTLPGKNDANTVFIPVGLISEGGDDLRVAHHIFVDSRAPWDEIGDGGTQHPREFGSAPA